MISLEYDEITIQLIDYQETTQVFDTKTSFRRTMTGSLRTWKLTNCINKFSIPIRFLTNAKVEEYLAFINLAQGKSVKYTDSSGDVYYVYITDASAIITEVTRYLKKATLSLEEVT